MHERYDKTAFLTLLEWFHRPYFRTSALCDRFLHVSWAYLIKTDRLIVFGGGYPIQTQDGIIGGIGVSGAHYSDDMEVAKAGLAAL